MEETFKARYIDPMIDWSFKRLFGSEVNKDILIEFLKVIFPEFDIEDITYLPSEQLGIMEKDRRASIRRHLQGIGRQGISGRSAAGRTGTLLREGIVLHLLPDPEAGQEGHGERGGRSEETLELPA